MLDGDANVCQTPTGWCRRSLSACTASSATGYGARELVVQRLKESGHLIPHIAKTKKGEEVRTRRRTAPDRDAFRRPRRRGDRAVADRPMVCRCGEAGGEAHRGGATAMSRSSRNLGRRPSSTGWRTSSRGVSAASYGGGTASRLVRGRHGRVVLSDAEAQAQAGEGVALTQDDDVLDTWFSARCGPSPRHARLREREESGRGGLQSPSTPPPQRPAHLGLRHPVLLGCADDDDGAVQHRVRRHGRKPVSPRPCPCRPTAPRCRSPRAMSSTRSG